MLRRETRPDTRETRLGPSSIELDLLLRCVRARIGSDEAERIATLAAGPVNWEYLQRTASRHWVLPLLYRGLRTVDPGLVPAPVLNQLRTFFHTNGMLNRLRTGELLKVLDLFEEDNISAIPFKGPVLAASVYGELAYRSFVDLDILVAREDVRRVGELLRDRGYRQLGKELPLNELQQEAYDGLTHQHAFGRTDERGVELMVEIQWAFASRYFSSPLDPQRVRSRATLVPFEGRSVPSLHPEDLLLFLCLHGTRHLWDRLQWICDVAELVGTYPELDWQAVQKQAEELGLRRMLYLGLRLARELADAPLPEPVWAAVRNDIVVERLAREVSGRITGGDEALPQMLEIRRFHFRIRERLRDKCRYGLLAVRPTPKDWALLPLPGRLSFLYYVLRPARIFYEIASSFFGNRPSK